MAVNMSYSGVQLFTITVSPLTNDRRTSTRTARTRDKRDIPFRGVRRFLFLLMRILPASSTMSAVETRPGSHRDVIPPLRTAPPPSTGGRRRSGLQLIFVGSRVIMYFENKTKQQKKSKYLRQNTMLGMIKKKIRKGYHCITFLYLICRLIFI